MTFERSVKDVSWKVVGGGMSKTFDADYNGCAGCMGQRYGGSRSNAEGGRYGRAGGESSGVSAASLCEVVLVSHGG